MVDAGDGQSNLVAEVSIVKPLEKVCKPVVGWSRNEVLVYAIHKQCSWCVVRTAGAFHCTF